MDNTLNSKNDKGYHIRNFGSEARRVAKAAAALAGCDIGSWISQAVFEKYQREVAHAKGEKE